MMKSIFGKMTITGRGVNWHLSSLPIKILVLAFFLSFSNVSQPKAQAAYFWSEQQRIPEYYDIAYDPPYLIADQNNVVHAFNSQPLQLSDETSPKAIFYRQWSLESGWTAPNDIFYDGNSGSIDVLDVTSDSLGVLYLIYQKDFGDIYFTYAYLAQAGRSTAWSSPIQIGSQSTHVTIGFEGVGAIAVDNGGNIVVIYSGSESGDGLYSTYSSDHGDNWSQPYPVYLTGDESLVVTDPELSLGESGKIHGVWTTFQSDGFAGPGYYANFDPKDGAWSEPMDLDVPGIRTPSVIEFESDVFVSYYHFSTNGNWWRRSSDGANTWTAPSQLSPRHVGTNGRVSFVVDSTNTLHGFFGQRINDFNHGMWEMIWTGDTWTTPDPVVKGPTVRDVIGGNGFDPRSARAVVSNGNLVLVTWTTDGFAGGNGAWYSYNILNAPVLPSQPNPEPTLAITPLSTNTPVESTTIESTITAVPVVDLSDRESSGLLLNPQTSIFSGVTFATIFLIGVFILRYLAQLRKG
ncbi:MAG: sialidase family protein [Chloroflexota bacterium]